MNEVPYSRAQVQLAALMEKATEDREPITITREGKEPVVLLAADDYRSLMETAYLLRSPKNARRLLEALADARAGRNLHHLTPDELQKKLGLSHEINCSMVSRSSTICVHTCRK